MKYLIVIAIIQIETLARRKYKIAALISANDARAKDSQYFYPAASI